MKRTEAERAIRPLVRKWAKETGVQHEQEEVPEYLEFRSWVNSQGYGHYLTFRSTMGAFEDAERWFDEELGQAWRN